MSEIIVTLGIMRKVGQYKNPIQAHDTSKEWQSSPSLSIMRKVGQYKNPIQAHDTFKIRDVTLGPARSNFYINLQGPTEKHAYIIRRTLQPPGIPWLLNNVTTLAWCWRMQLRDGTILGFTSHDKNLLIGGITYEASSGFIPTSVDTTKDLSVDNLDVEGFLDTNTLDPQDLLLGRYDFASILFFVCNWQDLTDPMLVLRRGTLGRITKKSNTFSAEVRGMLEAYQQRKGELFQKTCRAHLGDARCKLNIDNYKVNGQVTYYDPVNQFIYTNIINTTGMFNYGILQFNSGANNTGRYEIKEYQFSPGVGRFLLYLPAAMIPMPGDQISVWAGCDYNYSTCRDKFGNYLNFRGEPHIPGNDYIATAAKH